MTFTAVLLFSACNYAPIPNKTSAIALISHEAKSDTLANVEMDGDSVLLDSNLIRHSDIAKSEK